MDGARIVEVHDVPGEIRAIMKQKPELAIVGAGVVGLNELFVLLFSLNTLSSLRAYVGGEGLWSKAQKDAVYYLNRYADTAALFQALGGGWWHRADLAKEPYAK